MYVVTNQHLRGLWRGHKEKSSERCSTNFLSGKKIIYIQYNLLLGMSVFKRRVFNK